MKCQFFIFYVWTFCSQATKNVWVLTPGKTPSCELIDTHAGHVCCHWHYQEFILIYDEYGLSEWVRRSDFPFRLWSSDTKLACSLWSVWKRRVIFDITGWCLIFNPKNCYHWLWRWPKQKIALLVRMLILHEDLEFLIDREKFQLKKGIFLPMGQKDGNFWFWSTVYLVISH